MLATPSSRTEIETIPLSFTFLGPPLFIEVALEETG